MLGPPGAGKGNTGRAVRASPRDSEDLHGRHPSRGRECGHRYRVARQGGHGSGRAGRRRRDDWHREGAAGSAGRAEGVRSGGLSAHRGAGEGARRHRWRAARRSSSSTSSCRSPSWCAGSASRLDLRRLRRRPRRPATARDAGHVHDVRRPADSARRRHRRRRAGAPGRVSTRYASRWSSTIARGRRSARSTARRRPIASRPICVRGGSGRQRGAARRKGSR